MTVLEQESKLILNMNQRPNKRKEVQHSRKNPTLISLREIVGFM